MKREKSDFGAYRTKIEQRIARVLPELTQAHRRVADFVLAHPLRAATSPIDELAEAVGVSVATANRFARALEFDSYAAFKAELVAGFEPVLAPVERLRGTLTQPRTVGEVFGAALEESASNIDATRQKLDIAACEQAVSHILSARTVFILGFGSSGWLAGLLHHGLDTNCPDVRLLATASGPTLAARALARCTPGDVLVVLTFPRYLTDTVALTQAARARGAIVIALTDRPTSPVAPLGHVVLYAQTETRYRPNCESSVLALAEALASAVALRAPGAVQSAERTAEAVMPWLYGEHSLREANSAPSVRRHSSKDGK